jgi:hypothetical protein
MVSAIAGLQRDCTHMKRNEVMSKTHKSVLDLFNVFEHVESCLWHFLSS